MRTIELIGHVDEHHQLRAEVPADVRPGPVRVVVALPDEADDEFSNAWAKAVAAAWAADWSDPRDDIYTLEDGEPVNGKG
jgi:hypothetical protein